MNGAFDTLICVTQDKRRSRRSRGGERIGIASIVHPSCPRPDQTRQDGEEGGRGEGNTVDTTKSTEGHCSHIAGDACHLSHAQIRAIRRRCFTLGNVPRSIITAVDFFPSECDAFGKRLRKSELLATAFAPVPRTRRPIPPSPAKPIRSRRRRRHLT